MHTNNHKHSLMHLLKELMGRMDESSPSYIVQSYCWCRLHHSTSGPDNSTDLPLLCNNKCNPLPHTLTDNFWLDQICALSLVQAIQAVSYLCIHCYSPFMSVMHNHSSLLHRLTFCIYALFTMSIHPICGLFSPSSNTFHFRYLFCWVSFFHYLHMPKSLQYSKLC